MAQIEFLIHLTPVAHWPNPFLTVPDFWTYSQQVGELELNTRFTSSNPPMPNCRLFPGGEAGVKICVLPLLPPMPNSRLFQGGEANQIRRKKQTSRTSYFFLYGAATQQRFWNAVNHSPEMMLKKIQPCWPDSRIHQQSAFLPAVPEKYITG